MALAESDLVQAVPAENPDRLAHTLAAALTAPTQGKVQARRTPAANTGSLIRLSALT